MACTITGITQDNCAAADGGIYKSYITESTSITAITIAAGIVSAITMATTGAWKKFVYDDQNDTAYYNQTGERNNNKHNYTQVSFMSFSGLDSAKMISADSLKDCCSLVAIHFHNNGIVTIQGIEKNGTSWRLSKKVAKATINILTDTGANEDRVEVTINSTSRFASFTTSLTDIAIEAL